MEPPKLTNQSTIIFSYSDTPGETRRESQSSGVTLNGPPQYSSNFPPPIPPSWSQPALPTFLRSLIQRVNAGNLDGVLEIMYRHKTDVLSLGSGVIDGLQMATPANAPHIQYLLSAIACLNSTTMTSAQIEYDACQPPEVCALLQTLYPGRIRNSSVAPAPAAGPSDEDLAKIKTLQAQIDSFIMALLQENSDVACGVLQQKELSINAQTLKTFFESQNQLNELLKAAVSAQEKKIIEQAYSGGNVSTQKNTRFQAPQRDVKLLSMLQNALAHPRITTPPRS